MSREAQHLLLTRCEWPLPPPASPVESGGTWVQRFGTTENAVVQLRKAYCCSATVSLTASALPPGSCGAGCVYALASLSAGKPRLLSGMRGLASRAGALTQPRERGSSGAAGSARGRPPSVTGTVRMEGRESWRAPLSELGQLGA